MNNVVSGSFAEFDPNSVIESINENLKIIFKTREDDKQKWFADRREKGKTTGIWWWKKTEPWDETELNELWLYGDDGDDGDFWSAKYRLWDKWDYTISAFEKLRTFCELAIDQGNNSVHLSKEDAVFALNWNKK